MRCKRLLTCGAACVVTTIRCPSNRCRPASGPRCPVSQLRISVPDISGIERGFSKRLSGGPPSPVPKLGISVSQETNLEPASINDAATPIVVGVAYSQACMVLDRGHGALLRKTGRRTCENHPNPLSGYNTTLVQGITRHIQCVAIHNKDCTAEIRGKKTNQCLLSFKQSHDEARGAASSIMYSPSPTSDVRRHLPP